MGSLGEQYEAQREAEAKEARPAGPFTARSILIGAGVAVGVAALAVVVAQLLPPSGRERYEEDRTKLRKAVIVHYTGYSPIRPSYQGSAVSFPTGFQQYPTQAWAKAGAAAAVQEADATHEEIESLLLPQSNPSGGKDQSGTPSWEDVDGDGERDPVGEKLFYLESLPEPTVDHWNTATVTVEGTDFIVDSRDWFVDIDRLVEGEFLKEAPESASPDNSAHGRGSYSWYVDENGKLRSMLYRYPVPETDGFQDVYP